ncbi:unnamed protein product [Paramecium sonneborni]|uniref:Uncharacterized protein n=1 Tax=Paramecium sonneborni TaxID=65129 RepID=A0A8S1RMH6_9CILI|nr:unnamed protein product [Paramecium sonneborni]
MDCQLITQFAATKNLNYLIYIYLFRYKIFQNLFFHFYIQLWVYQRGNLQYEGRTLQKGSTIDELSHLEKQKKNVKAMNIVLVWIKLFEVLGLDNGQVSSKYIIHYWKIFFLVPNTYYVINCMQQQHRKEKKLIPLQSQTAVYKGNLIHSLLLPRDCFWKNSLQKTTKKIGEGCQKVIEISCNSNQINFYCTRSLTKLDKIKQESEDYVIKDSTQEFQRVRPQFCELNYQKSIGHDLDGTLFKVSYKHQKYVLPKISRDLISEWNLEKQIRQEKKISEITNLYSQFLLQLF